MAPIKSRLPRLIRFNCLAIAFSIVVILSPAHASARQRLLMDFGWRFNQGDPADAPATFESTEPGALDKTHEADLKKWEDLGDRKDADDLGQQVSFVAPGFDDSGWTKLDLPHDWVVALPFNPRGNVSHGRKDIDPTKGTNIGWYRRSFALSDADRNKTLCVEFDGVYRNSLAWLNGHFLGRYRSGYNGFQYDITRFSKFDGQNELVVRADATRTEGWFYEGGGIYRHVWLVKTNPLHVTHWGTFVTTDLQGLNAKLNVRTEIQNDANVPASATLTTTLLDAEGKTVAESTSPLQPVAPGPLHWIENTSITVASPNLWSPDSPYLYKVVSTIKKDGTAGDVYETPIGIRTASFDPNQGFLLNGKRVEIKGTCNHQDHAGVGSALPDRLQEFRIQKLIEMGSNAYRTSHNPPTPELLDECDRQGMMVLDENRRFDARPESIGQLTSMIERDRNHPSVIAWSLGNEESEMQRTDTGTQVMKTLQDLAHRLDPSRFTTYAHNGGGKTWAAGLSQVIQVLGSNYFSYSNKDIDNYHKAHPAQPIIGTEEASTLTTRGEYAKDAQKGFMYAYDLEGPRWGSTAEKWWTFFHARPFLAGAFVWTGFDYRGEPTPYRFAYSSQFGIMDTCGFPKDIFYYYQSWWGAQPVLHLFPHWNWAGKEGKPIDVWVFSNCEEVELFLNGASQGRQRMLPDSHLQWSVKYAPGTLLARGYKGGKQILEQSVETTGEPAAIKLIPDRSTIDANGEDLSIITAEVVDAQGRVVPTADNLITFDIQGGKFLGVGNGNPNTMEMDKFPKRKLFNGLAELIVQSTKDPGPITIVAHSENLKEDRTTIQTRPAILRPAVP